MRISVCSVLVDACPAAVAAGLYGGPAVGADGFKVLASGIAWGEGPMKTSDLIDMLSAEVEVVDRRKVPRAMAAALAAGAGISVCAILLALGARADLDRPQAFVFLAGKLVFMLGIVALAVIFLVKLARPVGERYRPMGVVLLPFVVIVGLGVLSVPSAPGVQGQAMIAGEQCRECWLIVPAIAMVPFALVVWALRRAAPTHLIQAGALVGLIAGGIGAMAYALHCVSDSMPFVALWCAGTIVLCTLAGAALGPRLREAAFTKPMREHVDTDMLVAP